ncbi:thioredoxin [Candidatus Bathyarchaeota archaeon ex4484_135]|nr:MAG: thioredoxin [Candidatus Bathyarchaeota archaeon ex4484_135]
MSDEELERLRLKKMKKLLKKLVGKEKSNTNKPVELTDQDFRSFVKSGGLVVVDFWAPWCPPCRYLAPIIKELAREYAGRIKFGKLNVDKNPKTARRYGIRAIPTLLVFKNGSLVDRIIGAMPKEMLEAKLKKHLAG